MLLGVFSDLIPNPEPRSRAFSMIQNNPDALDKLRKVRLLILDVDGVLTDGGIVYNDRGEETKVFNAKDGLGIRMLLDAGIGVCIVTGRRSAALNHRCVNLGISSVMEGVSDKGTAFDTVLHDSGVTSDRIGAVGDDLPDLPLLRKAGCAISVADGHNMVRETSDLVTTRNGGDGAVREVCEGILKVQGHWEAALARWI